MKILYETRATAIGGRTGSAASVDGRLRAKLDRPRTLGGCGHGDGTNPEQLFAAGYAASFLSALRSAAAREDVPLAPDSNITTTVAVGSDARGDGLALTIGITADLPDIDPGTAERLVELAHAHCPYSKAMRGNVAIRLTLL